MWQGDGAPALMQMMEKGDDLLSSLAHALGLPAKRIKRRSSAIGAADTGRMAVAGMSGPSADVVGASVFQVQGVSPAAAAGRRQLQMARQTANSW